MSRARAVYTSSNNQVTLTPPGTLNLTKSEELIAIVGLLTDTLGREIDGNDDGQPGGGYIATITRSRVNTGGSRLSRNTSASDPATAVDTPTSSATGSR